MRRALIQGGLITALALVFVVASPLPAAAGGGSSYGGGFAVGGGHGGFGFHYGSWSGSRGFGHGNYGYGYNVGRPTFGFGRGQYPGPRRLGHGWLDQADRPPVATPLPSPGWGHSGRYGHVRRVDRRVAYQYLACGPYPCAPFGIGFFGPAAYGQQVHRAYNRVDSPRYRGTGRYDRYRVD